MGRFLVTGGCGFIGSHVCHRLVEGGHSVLVLDDLSTGKRENLPAGVDLVVDSVANGPVVSELMAGVDGCFHLAAVASVQRSLEDWLGTNAANLVGTIAVFDAARRHDRVPVVYASSAAVYGETATLPLGETATTAPVSAYGADKLACELHALVATDVHGVPTTGFRFFNVFGPRQDPASPYSGVISIFIDRFLSQGEIQVFGDGQQSRDFVYVGDVVDHLIAAMHTPDEAARVLNVCTGRSTTLLDLIATLRDITGRSPAVVHRAARAGDIRHSLGSPERSRAVLGVEARTTLREGLACTIESLTAAEAPRLPVVAPVTPRRHGAGVSAWGAHAEQ